MANLQEFIDMGGYGAFVWPAYLVAAAVLGLLWLSSMREWRRSQAELSALQRERDTAGAGSAAGGQEPA